MHLRVCWEDCGGVSSVYMCLPVSSNDTLIYIRESEQERSFWKFVQRTGLRRVRGCSRLKVM